MDRTVEWILLAVGVAVLIVLAVSVVMMNGMGMMGEGMMGSPFGMILVFLVPVVVIVVVGAAIARLLSPRTASSVEGALDILDRRYARGEIERDEYERMRADLRRG